MEALKSYTDLVQSRALAEILPHNTADHIYERFTITKAKDVPKETLYEHNGNIPFQYCSGIGIPCWSLAALLDYMHKVDLFPDITDFNGEFKLVVSYVNEEEEKILGNVQTIIIRNENLIDGCVEMIIKLHDLNLL